MDFQNNQETPPIPQDHQMTYEYYPPPNNQAYPPPQLYPNNSPQNQFYQNSQYQIPNYNVIQQQEIIPNNQYNLAPQEPLITTPFEGNKL